jgi:16S rRNA (uracil1498-N3)-methyltransferase
LATLRLFVGGTLQLAPGLQADLPEHAVRHAQVRRVQPGDWLRLFDGQGADWPAQVLDVGRKHVRVEVGNPQPVALELPTTVTLAVVVPANERMDNLVEKATELGVACIQPLMAERSVLRLVGERAQRRQQHWQAVAVAASEQCGRARVPEVAAVQPLLSWLQALAAVVDPPHSLQQARWLLSLYPQAQPLGELGGGPLAQVISLSGPEGGFAPDEERAAQAAGFKPVSLGPRVLRADTAPLALLAWVGLRQPSGPA